MKLLLALTILLSGCAQSDTAFRSRVQSVGVNANGNAASGDYGGSVVLTLRDPRTGFSK
jgi:hypothetical protein